MEVLSGCHFAKERDMATTRKPTSMVSAKLFASPEHLKDAMSARNHNFQAAPYGKKTAAASARCLEHDHLSHASVAGNDANRYAKGMCIAALARALCI